jgi:hypothetical protein
MSVFRNAMRRLDRDERGMETMQAVIIFGAAAIVLALLYKLRTPIMSWVNTQLQGFGISGG